MALTTTNLNDWINNLNLNPQDLVNILVGTGVEVVDDTIQITQFPVEDNPDSQDDNPDSQDDNPDSLTATDGDNGTTTVNPDGSITYTPEPDFYGTDSYTYTIDDGNGGTSSTTVFVTVNPDSAVDDLVVTDEDTPVTTSVFDNDAYEPLTIGVANNGTNGTATVNANGTITYTPELDFDSTDTFTYTIDHGNGVTSSTTVLVTANIFNGELEAADDFVVTNGDNPVSIAVLDQLAVTTEPTNGTTTVNAANGNITYIPDPDFNGSDSYTYTIDYGKGLTSSATVSLTVNPVNDAPEAVNDIVITDENTSVTTAVLNNDTDRDEDPLTVTVATDGTNGITTVNSNNSNSGGTTGAELGFDSYQAIGYFEGGISEDIGIETGVILSSGDIGDASGPNEGDGTGQALGTPGDTDLDIILNPDLANNAEDGADSASHEEDSTEDSTSDGEDSTEGSTDDGEDSEDGSTNDAIALEFDFIPENEEFVFEYVFASEEYNEYANSSFNDIFAFLLDGENVALIPGTTTPVSINNINASENSNYFRNNDLDDVAEEDLLNTEFDGLTTVLGVRGFVTPGQTHNLKLVIADTSDSIYDSAVFLKAGSLSTAPAIADAILNVNEKDIVTIDAPIASAFAKLKFTLSGTDTDSINEVGVFEVDDNFGTIDGVVPGSAEYEQLALGKITSRAIFTGLHGSLMDGQNLSRIMNYDVGSKLGFYLITDGTSDTMLSDDPLYFYNPAPNILFSFPEANSNFQDPLKVTENNNVLTLSWEDDSADNDYNDLVLTVEVADPSTVPVTALTSRRQGDPQKEIIDLSILDDNATITASIDIWSETVYDNRVGLYRLENAQGAVFDPFTQTTITPDQSGYLEAAIRQRVFEFDKNGGGNIELESGYYAPYIIVDGTAEQWLSSNPNNFWAGDTFAYVPFSKAETSLQTNIDRVALLGDNVFGFEDEILAESDYDYNDMVIKVNFPDNLPSSPGNIATNVNSTIFNSDGFLSTPINRFQNEDLPGTYLYAAEAESQNIRANFPNLLEEGQAFKVAAEPGDNLISINRFQNQDLPGTYLYAAEAESQNIRANFPNLLEEGIAFYVYDGAANLGVDVYRFQNQDLPGTYIFVTESERQNILDNFPNFLEEGVAFEVEI